MISSYQALKLGLSQRREAVLTARLHRGDVAILTGDLVRSSRAAPAAVARAMGLLGDIAAEIAAWAPGSDARFTRFRGDGWQMHLARPALALRAALRTLAGLAAVPNGLATRAAIGIGPATSLGTASLADADGPAFAASGRALDAMGRGRRLAVDGAGVGPLHRAVVDLLDERSARWTRPQAEAMALALGPAAPPARDLAARLGISPQALSYRLTGAGLPAIRSALAAWEADFGRAPEGAG